MTRPTRACTAGSIRTRQAPRQSRVRDLGCPTRPFSRSEQAWTRWPIVSGSSARSLRGRRNQARDQDRHGPVVGGRNAQRKWHARSRRTRQPFASASAFPSTRSSHPHAQGLTPSSQHRRPPHPGPAEGRHQANTQRPIPPHRDRAQTLPPSLQAEARGAPRKPHKRRSSCR